MKHPSRKDNQMIPEPTEALIEAGSEAVYDFLDARFPDGAMPGGKQLFADDHLDAEFKHEAGCTELAKAVLRAAALTREPEAGKLREALEDLLALTERLAASKVVVASDAPIKNARALLTASRNQGEIEMNRVRANRYATAALALTGRASFTSRRFALRSAFAVRA
jgi:hypothetical protein